MDLPRDYPTLTETLRILDCLAGVDRAQWNALAAGNPTLAWEFLHSLKEKGRQIAENWIKTDYAGVGMKSTFDVEEHFFGKL